MKKIHCALFACVLTAALPLGLTACGGEPNGNDTPTETAAPGPYITVAQISPNENDPYSSVVKELYDEVLSHSIDMNYDFISEQHFALYDVDGNGVNELLLGVEMWEDGEITLHSICAIQNGVAMKPISLWTDDDSPVVLFDNATIMTKRASDNERRITYYRFEDGELKYQTGLRYGDDYSLEYDDGEYYRRESGEYIPITKEEFDRVKQEMEGDGQVVELDWKPLAEYGQ